MTWFDALILGIVEGLTEYLPVSSTGHLLLAQRLLGIPDDEASKAFAIVIQAGAIIAVLGIYTRRVGEMVQGLAGRNPAGLKLAMQIIVAFLPAAVIGLAFESKIKKHLFGLWPICWAWLIGGLVILAFSAKQKHEGGKSIGGLTLGGAFAIGLAQCVAMIPGTSRSLVTILGGLLIGLNVAAALEFSFLLGLVTLTAATAYDTIKHGAAIRAAYDPAAIAIGFAAAAGAAFVAVKGMIAYVQSRGLAVFGWYRIVLALAIGALLWTGRLTP